MKLFDVTVLHRTATHHVRVHARYSEEAYHQAMAILGIDETSDHSAVVKLL